MKAANMQMRGMMIALGGNYASVSLLGWIKVSGIVGHLIKTIIMRGYRYGLHIQCTKGIKMMDKSKGHCRF